MKAALAFALIFPTAYTFGYFVVFAGQQGAAQTVFAASKIIQFAFPAVLIFFVRKERFTWQRPDSRAAMFGTAFGFAIAVAMFALYFGWLKPAGFFDKPAAMIHEKVKDLGLNTRWKYFAVGVFYSLGHSLLEEYYWRWFMLGQLRKFWPVSAAVTVSSLGFMAHHVVILGTFFGWTSPATYLLSAAIAIGGAVWAWLYERTGSLYGPWCSHALIDAAIFLIGYDLIRGSLV